MKRWRALLASTVSTLAAHLAACTIFFLFVFMALGLLSIWIGLQKYAGPMLGM
jgi:hypothetical protein